MNSRTRSFRAVFLLLTSLSMNRKTIIITVMRKPKKTHSMTMRLRDLFCSASMYCWNAFRTGKSSRPSCP